MKPKYRFRLIKESDHPFIHDAWFKTMRPRYAFTDGQLLKKAISFHVEQALEKGKMQSVVACDEEDHDVIFAFLVWHQVSPTMCAIDFGYTKNYVRRLGFQKALLLHVRDYQTKVVTIQAPSFSSKEFVNEEGEMLGYHLKKKYDLVIDPFLYERLGLMGVEK